MENVNNISSMIRKFHSKRIRNEDEDDDEILNDGHQIASEFSEFCSHALTSAEKTVVSDQIDITDCAKTKKARDVVAFCVFPLPLLFSGENGPVADISKMKEVIFLVSENTVRS